MATNTYVALQTQTLSSTASSVVFNSIPQTYTDLVLVISAKNTTGQNYETFLRFNSDSGSNYSQTFMQNYAGSTQSGRNSNINQITPGKMNTTSFDVNIIQINNYSNSTTNKTILSRLNNGEFVSGALVGLWRNTAAITRIEALTESGTNYTAGSTFTLYGIANSDIGAPKAFGGVITQDANYTYHTFGASGTFTPTQSLSNVEALVVAGGGGGGCAGGGGGAGSLIYRSGMSLTATGYSITVGSGGAGDSTRTAAPAASGTASTFNGTSATGGGGGASNNGNIAGGNGGSGGGGVGTGAGGTASAGTLNGGTGYVNIGGTSTSNASGGGGAGGAGGASIGSAGGLGGIGSALFSSWLYPTGMGVAGYITGGGAGYSDLVNAGGLGGGGDSGTGSNNGQNGRVNTGSGAGGSRNNGGGAGGTGGSGVVIIRYAN